MDRADPHDVLGVAAGATPAELTAAYRRAARRWHPDRAPEPGAAERMAEINGAYELLRAGLWQHRRGAGGPRSTAGAPAAAPRPGEHLPPAVRAALGPELLATLLPREGVELVTPAATWTSPQTLLAVTDRRLLWLLDDAPVHRVRFARFRDLAEVAVRTPRLTRETRELRLRTHRGRRLSFGDLRPATAEAIAAHARKGGACAPAYP